MKRVTVELQGVWVCPACKSEQSSLLERSEARRGVWLMPSVLDCRDCGEQSRAESVAHQVRA